MSRPLLLVALGLVATGCATTKFGSEWKSPEFASARYQKAMVLVIGPPFKRRQTAEDHIVAELRKRGAGAVRSWDVLTDEATKDRQQIVAAVRASGADALIGVRVANVDTEVRWYEGLEQWAASGTGLDYYGYVYTSYEIVRKPDKAELRTVGLESTLWDVASAKLVWSGRSETESAKQTVTVGELADGFAEVLVKRLEPYLRTR